MLEFFVELWGVVQTGISLGQLTSTEDVQTSFQLLLQSAHSGAWEDIMQEGNLNNGQYSLALSCQDAGSEYLESITVNEWSAADYMDYMDGAVDGASEALSISIEKSAYAINHAVISTGAGLTEWAAGFESDWGENL